MKVGDKVKMSPVWKYEEATGEIEKIIDGYTVVKWHGIPGYWHYTPEQSSGLELIEDNNEGR